MFKRPPFWNGSSYEIKKCGIQVIFNGISCLPNFMKIYRSAQKCLVGDTQAGDLISLLSFFGKYANKNVVACAKKHVYDYNLLWVPAEYKIQS
jgi:hypothetical protein